MRLDSKGFSLTEIMVALALMGGISLVTMKLVEDQVGNEAYLKNQAEVEKTVSLIQQNLNDTDRCNSMLNGQTIGSPLSTVGYSFETADGSMANRVLLQAGNDYGAFALNPGDIRLEEPTNNLPSSSGFSLVDLVIDFNVRKLKGQDTRVVRRKIPVMVLANGPTVESCGAAIVDANENAEKKLCDSLGAAVYWDTGTESCQLNENLCPEGQIPSGMQSLGTITCVDPVAENQLDLEDVFETSTTNCEEKPIIKVIRDPDTGKIKIACEGLPGELAWVLGSTSTTRPNPDSYGSIAVNVVHTYTLRNSGAGPTDPISLSISGTNADRWEFATGSTCSNGLSLAPGATCRVNVRFKGAGAPNGSYGATLSAAADNSGNATNEMTANITPVLIAWTNGVAMEYGTIYEDTTKTLTLKNNGVSTTPPLTISFDAAAGPWQILPPATGGCVSGTTVLSPGGTCTVRVRFNVSGHANNIYQKGLKATASTGDSTLIYLNATLQKPSWTLVSSRHLPSTSAGETTQPSGYCNNPGDIKYHQIASIPGGAQVSYINSGESCGTGGRVRFKLTTSSRIRECGKSSPTWTLKTGGASYTRCEVGGIDGGVPDLELDCDGPIVDPMCSAPTPKPTTGGGGGSTVEEVFGGYAASGDCSSHKYIVKQYKCQ